MVCISYSSIFLSFEIKIFYNIIYIKLSNILLNMIELKRYITNNTSKNIMIENELELHFYSEFILNESLNNDCFKIFEKYGSYIGQKELIIDLSKEIYNIIRNHEPINNIKLNKKDIKGYDNIFFNELEIQLTNKNTGYVVSKSNFNKSKNEFDLVYINISINEYHEYKDLVRCIMHEILHAWNNYQNYVKDSEFNLKELTDKNSKYYKSLFDGSLTVTNICKRICNNISKIEQNAYLNELTTELYINKFDVKKFSNINDAYKKAYEIFKQSDVWIQYSSLWNWIKYLKNNDEDDKLEFQNTYNNINDTNLSFNKIYKKLDNQFNKILKKFETNVPKIFCDYYEEQMNKNVKEGLQHPNNSLIKFVQFINEYNLLESVKPENGKNWEVYVNNKLDNTFTEWSKKWKKQPKIGHGWYAGGTVFKVVKIEDNKVYTEEDKTIKP